MSKDFVLKSCLIARLAIALVLTAVPSAHAFPTNVTIPAQVLRAADEIPNMAQVAPNLYRGGMPNEAALAELRRAGITTVVSFANEKKYLNAELNATKRLGMKFIYIPLSAWQKPSQNDVDAFMSVIDKKDREPVFVHCVHGRDRTGAMVAMYRIRNEGWPASMAYTEMKERGFRTFFRNLSKAVFEFEKRQQQVALTS